MLSSFVEIDGIEVRKHPVICRYMKGSYNMNPSLPKQFYMGGGSSSLKNHDYKRNLKLTAILCGQRPKEILRHIDIYNLSFEQNFLVTALVT